jgi:hypothetical protein
MPKTSIDYSKTVIYMIKHETKPDLLYVGSTTDFTKRKNKHKVNCRSTDKKHIKLYTTINENGGWGDFRMIQIKEFPCNNKREAEHEEEKCRAELNASLNSHKAFVDTKQSKHQWYEDNKVRITTEGKERYLRNKETHDEKSREYYAKNKESINALNNAIEICECGCDVMHSYKSRHMKTDKHLKAMKEKLII